MSLVTVEGVSIIDELRVEWVAEVELSYRPAQLFGRMENSTPEEAEEDILSVLTIPAGYEERVPEERISAAAWKLFEQQRREGDA